MSYFFFVFMGGLRGVFLFIDKLIIFSILIIYLSVNVNIIFTIML